MSFYKTSMAVIAIFAILAVMPNDFDDTINIMEASESFEELMKESGPADETWAESQSATKSWEPVGATELDAAGASRKEKEAILPMQEAHTESMQIFREPSKTASEIRINDRDKVLEVLVQATVMVCEEFPRFRNTAQCQSIKAQPDITELEASDEKKGSNSEGWEISDDRAGRAAGKHEENTGGEHKEEETPAKGVLAESSSEDAGELKGCITRGGIPELQPGTTEQMFVKWPGWANIVTAVTAGLTAGVVGLLASSKTKICGWMGNDIKGAAMVLIATGTAVGAQVLPHYGCTALMEHPDCMLPFEEPDHIQRCDKAATARDGICGTSLRTACEAATNEHHDMCKRTRTPFQWRAGTEEAARPLKGGTVFLETSAGYDAGMSPCSATFIDNVGNRSPNKIPLKINDNTFVFGHASDWYKMVAVDAQGKKIENRYMSASLALTRSNWENANRGGSYSISDVQMCTLSPTAPPTSAPTPAPTESCAEAQSKARRAKKLQGKLQADLDVEVEQERSENSTNPILSPGLTCKTLRLHVTDEDLANVPTGSGITVLHAGPGPITTQSSKSVEVGGTYALTFWFKPMGCNFIWQPIIKMGSPTVEHPDEIDDQDNWRMFSTGAPGSLDMFGGSEIPGFVTFSFVSGQTATIPAVGQWYYYAFLVNATSVRVWINGMELQSPRWNSRGVTTVSQNLPRKTKQEIHVGWFDNNLKADTVHNYCKEKSNQFAHFLHHSAASLGTFGPDSPRITQPPIKNYVPAAMWAEDGIISTCPSSSLYAPTSATEPVGSCFQPAFSPVPQCNRNGTALTCTKLVATVVHGGATDPGAYFQHLGTGIVVALQITKYVTCKSAFCSVKRTVECKVCTHMGWEHTGKMISPVDAGYGQPPLRSCLAAEHTTCSKDFFDKMEEMAENGQHHRSTQTTSPVASWTDAAKREAVLRWRESSDTTARTA